MHILLSIRERITRLPRINFGFGGSSILHRMRVSYAFKSHLDQFEECRLHLPRLLNFLLSTCNALITTEESRIPSNTRLTSRCSCRQTYLAFQLIVRSCPTHGDVWVHGGDQFPPPPRTLLNRNGSKWEGRISPGNRTYNVFP